MKGTGRDDLVWIKATVEVTLWPNVNTAGHLSQPWHWGTYYQVLNINADGGHPDRRSVHLADWNGDGYCDVIYYVLISYEIEWWQNLYDKGKKSVSFSFAGKIDAMCTEGIGVGMFDLGLRLADIDGDKRADVLCMEPTSRTYGLLNIGQIKASINHERANLRWADVNVDGRADLLWVDQMNGNTHVWENGGIQAHTIDGSRFYWADKGKQYAGQTRGSNHYYPDLDGDGRADLHKINPVTNVGETFFNICPGAGGNEPGADDSNTFTESCPPPDPGQETDGGGGTDIPPWEESEQPCQAAKTYCQLNDCSVSGDHDLGNDGDQPLSRRSSRHWWMRRANSGSPPKGSGGDGYTGRDPICIDLPGWSFVVQPLRYPQWRRWLALTPYNEHILQWVDPQDCLDDVNVEEINAQDANGAWRSPLPREWETPAPNGIQCDHVIDLQVMALFLRFAITGRHLDGTTSSLRQLDPTDFDADWNAAGVLHGLTQSSIQDYIMEAFGSSSNPSVLIPIPAGVNGAKGRVMGLQNPLHRNDLAGNVANAVNANSRTQLTEALRPISNLFALYRYMNQPRAYNMIESVSNTISDRFGDVGRQIVSFNMVQALWDEWWARFITTAVQINYQYAYNSINVVTGRLSDIRSSLASETRIDLIALVDGLPTRITFRSFTPSPYADQKLRRQAVVRESGTAAPSPSR